MKYFKGHFVFLLLLLFVLSSCNMSNQSQNQELFTLGIWKVKPGKESEFIQEWTDFANWTGAFSAPVGKAYLLQDTQDPLRFISFGPWKNVTIIEQWRETEEFKKFVEKIQLLCDEFQPNTLTVAATSG